MQLKFHIGNNFEETALLVDNLASVWMHWKQVDSAPFVLSGRLDTTTRRHGEARPTKLDRLPVCIIVETAALKNQHEERQSQINYSTITNFFRNFSVNKQARTSYLICVSSQAFCSSDRLSVWFGLWKSGSRQYVSITFCCNWVLIPFILLDDLLNALPPTANSTRDIIPKMAQ